MREEQEKRWMRLADEPGLRAPLRRTPRPTMRMFRPEWQLEIGYEYVVLKAALAFRRLAGTVKWRPATASPYLN